MLPSVRFRPVILLLILMAPGPVRADDWPVPRGPSHEPAPFRFERALLDKIPREFLEDSAACILYNGVTNLIEPDGTVETISHEITRLNGRKGIEGLGEYRQITYDPTYQKLVLNEARIIKADGRIVPIEPRHLHLRDVSTDYQVYDRDKQLVISFPNLEVGDIYEVKWTTRGKNTEFFGQFFTRVILGDDNYPVVRDELRVRLPRDRPFRYASVNGRLEPTIKDDGKNRLYVWSATNRPALVQDSDRPSREELRLQVACSTFASWDEVGQWKNKLRKECWTCTPEIRTLIGRITAGMDSPLEKARALTHWVRRYVRYISISSAGHGYTPRLPGQVLASRYGDCKDQAQLLAVMLREIGLDVWLVTLGMLDDGQVLPDVPSPWGTHAILLVKIDGKNHWIDTTATHAAWDFLPRSDRDRCVYITRDNKIQLLRTPPLTWAENRTELTTRMWVQPDGGSINHRSVKYSGSAALDRRETWSDTPPGERRRLVTAGLQDAHSRTRLWSLAIDAKNLADLDQPVVAGMEFAIDGHFNHDLEGSITDSNVWNRILAFTLDSERKLPLNLGSPFESVHRYQVNLPLAYRFQTIPSSQEVHSRWGWFKLSVKYRAESPRTMEIVFHTRLENGLVMPRDFPDYQDFHDQVSRSWRLWLTVRPTEDLADARALEAQQILFPDPKSSAILGRLFRKHGRKEDTLRVLRRALFFFPGRKDLWELAVDSAPNRKEEEALYARMVKTFPGEPLYQVALGGIRVRRGNHVGAYQVLEPLTKNPSPQIQARAHYFLARSVWDLKNASLALKHLNAAHKADPEIVMTLEALEFRARVSEECGLYAQAMQTYRVALDLEPDNTHLLAALIHLEWGAGKSRAALDHLRRFTILADKDPQQLVQAANWHFKMGRLDDTLDLAMRSLQVRAHFSPAHRILGLAWLRMKDYPRALTHLELARDEADALVLEGLIRVNLALGNLSAAEAILKKCKTLREPTLNLRLAEELTRRLIRRRATVEKDVRAGPADKKFLLGALDAFVCSEYAFDQGLSQDGVTRLLARAFPSEVEIGPAYALRGLLALRQGNLSKALADADRAIELSPREGRAYLVRGLVRLERGHPDAPADLKQARELGSKIEE